MKDTEEINQRGTNIWALNRFRSDALTHFIQDLRRKNETGLDEEECKHVADTLEDLVIKFSEIPDGTFFRKSIYSRMIKFRDIYLEWNEVDNNDIESQLKRDKLRRKLTNTRKKFAVTMRKSHYQLKNEYDLRLVSDTYEALGKMAKALPDIFTELSKAVNRYFNKLGA